MFPQNQPELEKQIKKILITGTAGDLDAFTVAEYNPDLVGKLASFIRSFALTLLDEISLGEKPSLHGMAYGSDERRREAFRIDGYNQAVQDLHAKVEAIRKKYGL
jgi:hypothetical protein